jgi:transposase
MTQLSFATQCLDHLGIVAGICHRIDLIETIDTFIGQTRRPVSVGEAVIAMILNALGFVGRPLYLTPEFFSNKPVDLLIHPRLCAEDFTDDTLGRALDCLYEKGITEVFATVASQALSAFDGQHRFVHLDSNGV